MTIFFLAATLALIPASQAADLVVKVSKVTALATEEIVTISLEKFPSRAGIYLQQCQEFVPGTRPINCNAQTQLWISDMRGATFTPTSAISMKLVSRFDNVDCTQVKCGIFARYDHTAGTDTTEDQFISIEFVTDNTSTAITPSKTSESQSMAMLPKKVKVGKSIALPIQTTQASTLSYRSTTKKVCNVKGNVLKAVKSGVCKLQIFAPGVDGYGNFTSIHKLTLKR